MAITKIITPAVTDNAITLAKMASGTDGNIISYDASGNPVAIATGNDGQVLTSTGAGSPPAFEALPAGGITVAGQWRISATISNVGNDVLATNWEENDSKYARIGSAMAQSSGIFTFPSTGIYLVQFTINILDATNQQYIGGKIETTADNSSYDLVAEEFQHINVISSSGTYTNSTMSIMFDVSNTSNYKVRFAAFSTNGGADVNGNTSQNRTHATFIRLGDT